MFTTVFVAGYGNSPEGHWQNSWYKTTPKSYWVEQSDWNNPDCDTWVEALNTVLQSIDGPIVLVSHSLGGSTIVQWSKKYTANIIGAFMVAVPDVESEHLPQAIKGYETLPLAALPFLSIVLASTDDPYSSFTRTEYFAQCWGSTLINVGPLQHINSDSDIGNWPEGAKLLEQFVGSCM